MERPLHDDTDDYIARLEEHCEYLEEAIKAQVSRTDYWCTEATKARALYSNQVKETARLRRERPA